MEVTDLIPHRPPFLWVDRVLDIADGAIVAEKDIATDLEVFAGHYPDNPIMPGVLLCEAVFQTGAILMSHLQKNGAQESAQIPVITRIQSAKFKRIVKPGCTIRIEVKLKEWLSNVAYLKGLVRVDEKTAVQVEFSCAAVNSVD